MPTVMLVAEYGSMHGGERSLLAALKHLDHRRWRVVVAVPPQGALDGALSEQGIERVPLNLFDQPGGDRLSMEQIRQEISALAQRVSADLIHANSLSMSRHTGPIASQLGLPSIGHLRDIIKLSRQAIQDLNANSRLIAVSTATKQWHIQQGLDANKTVVVHNGVDVEKFQPRPATGAVHREWNLPDHHALIVGIGQLGLRKGVDTLVHAAESVVRSRSDVSFLWIGQRYSSKQESIDYEQALMKRIEQGVLFKHFRFVGYRDDVDKILNEATLLVHPARQEPLGRVLLEAAASGVPVIATDVGGTREIFSTHSNSAQLIAPDQPTALAEAILALLADPSEQARLAQSARNQVVNQFSAQQAARALWHQYEDVWSQHMM